MIGLPSASLLLKYIVYEKKTSISIDTAFLSVIVVALFRLLLWQDAGINTEN